MTSNKYPGKLFMVLMLFMTTNYIHEGYRGRVLPSVRVFLRGHNSYLSKVSQEFRKTENFPQVEQIPDGN